jgi:hypothetical protein
MKMLFAVIVALLSSCALDESVATSDLCAIADREAGACPQDVAVRTALQTTGAQYALDVSCHSIPGLTMCSVVVRVAAVTVEVECRVYYYRDDTGRLVIQGAGCS